MSKKKATASTVAASAKGTRSKSDRVKGAAAANPVRKENVEQPPAAPQAAPASRPPFRRPQSLNFAGVGRNDICPCGSGKRFKNCHGH